MSKPLPNLNHPDFIESRQFSDAEVSEIRAACCFPSDDEIRSWYGKPSSKVIEIASMELNQVRKEFRENIKGSTEEQALEKAKRTKAEEKYKAILQPPILKNLLNAELNCISCLIEIPDYKETQLQQESPRRRRVKNKLLNTAIRERLETEIVSVEKLTLELSKLPPEETKLYQKHYSNPHGFSTYVNCRQFISESNQKLYTNEKEIPLPAPAACLQPATGGNSRHTPQRTYKTNTLLRNLSSLSRLCTATAKKIGFDHNLYVDLETLRTDVDHRIDAIKEASTVNRSTPTGKMSACRNTEAIVMQLVAFYYKLTGEFPKVVHHTADEELMLPSMYMGKSLDFIKYFLRKCPELQTPDGTLQGHINRSVATLKARVTSTNG